MPGIIGPVVLASGLFLSAATAFASALDTLLTDLGKVETRHARFVEERTLGVLDETLVTEGTLFYEAPNRLIRQDLLPEPAVYEIMDEQLTIIVDGEERVLALDQEPMLAALVLPFRAMFAGDLEALQTMFEPAYRKEADGWIVRLTPKQSSPAAPFLDHIEIAGKETTILGMTVHEQDGDLSRMTLEPVRP